MFFVIAKSGIPTSKPGQLLVRKMEQWKENGCEANTLTHLVCSHSLPFHQSLGVAQP